MVEQLTVNQLAASSSLASGAKLNHQHMKRECRKVCKGLFVPFCHQARGSDQANQSTLAFHLDLQLQTVLFHELQCPTDTKQLHSIVHQSQIAYPVSSDDAFVGDAT